VWSFSKTLIFFYETFLLYDIMYGYAWVGSAQVDGIWRCFYDYDCDYVSFSFSFVIHRILRNMITGSLFCQPVT
jgi:hypothetical protein